MKYGTQNKNKKEYYVWKPGEMKLKIETVFGTEENRLIHCVKRRGKRNEIWREPFTCISSWRRRYGGEFESRLKTARDPTVTSQRKSVKGNNLERRKVIVEEPWTLRIIKQNNWFESIRNDFTRDQVERRNFVNWPRIRTVNEFS